MLLRGTNLALYMGAAFYSAFPGKKCGVERTGRCMRDWYSYCGRIGIVRRIDRGEWQYEIFSNCDWIHGGYPGLKDSKTLFSYFETNKAVFDYALLLPSDIESLKFNLHPFSLYLISYSVCFDMTPGCASKESPVYYTILSFIGK